ncbi:MAG TPA: argininosuccinate synthase [Candidatus Sumerlaeota bacterium]|nr:MAG: Argininosuccinate synthase [candidate division BRC1 bacterium ADurb.Bin183]HOE63393.1 argininosuccinate synthase [Candidatus Sumerlaeota bacterium]HRR30259.1 argininosuccinate synthase [Candidatus Sumerlaeia bacterium]HON50872.1 argininosuccinate synthase [Candidatus Sumerlaeota bacterium]HOR65566.1 argininosuccinate synthase [Candidatus Sumerlaeota bacterium]
MSPAKKDVKKVVLAYSGGLDTSVIVRWLVENYKCEVVCFTADMGHEIDPKILKTKAINSGAKKIVVKDLRSEFVQDFILPALKANALYEGQYPMATSLGRPLIAKWLVEVAHQEGADAVAHGCTGKGNDQVRMDVATRALDPRLKIIAPLREWEFKTRDEEIEYAKKHKIPVHATKKNPYSVDSNLWGASIECGVLEDPWTEPPADAYLDMKPLDTLNDKPEYVTIGFHKGVPVRLNDKKMTALAIIEKLKTIGIKHGIGRIDMVENRVVGIKSRETYEAPAATILITAHKAMESLTLDRETMHYKELLSSKFSELVYYGLWYSPLREALAAFFDKTQETVTGDVRLKLYRGNCIVVGRRSPYSLYQLNLATYDIGDKFDHSAAEGFIEIFGLPSRVIAAVNKLKG